MTEQFVPVFCTRDSRLTSPNKPLRIFAAIVNKAGGTRISIHNMGQTSVALILAEGVAIWAVSRRLGYAKTSIAMDVDSHVTPEMEERATESIGPALMG